MFQAPWRKVLTQTYHKLNQPYFLETFVGVNWTPQRRDVGLSPTGLFPMETWNLHITESSDSQKWWSDNFRGPRSIGYAEKSLCCCGGVCWGVLRMPLRWIADQREQSACSDMFLQRQETLPGSHHSSTCNFAFHRIDNVTISPCVLLVAFHIKNTNVTSDHHLLLIHKGPHSSSSQ